MQLFTLYGPLEHAQNIQKSITKKVLRKFWYWNHRKAKKFQYWAKKASKNVYIMLVNNQTEGLFSKSQDIKFPVITIW